MAPPLDTFANPEIDVALTDLGPLAWVLEELRKAVGGATRALRRFVADADGLTASEKSASDVGPLRIARQQLHQAAGAMDMVGQAAPARILRAMESAVQQCIQRPVSCNDDVINRIERAGFGLLQYLETILQGKAASAVSLFPQYRDVQALTAHERAHPADLWVMDWRWVDPGIPGKVDPLAYDAGVRARFERAVLNVIKSQDQSTSARLLCDISLGFAAAQTAKQPLIFWKIAAGFFEALAYDLCTNDVHVKRAISRILQQYSALVRGELGVSDRLAQDLVFFCAQGRPDSQESAPVLSTIRQSFGLTGWEPVNYEVSPFGLFDPALLTQARKRIGAVKEAWSSVAGGDLTRMRGLTDQFSLVADSLSKLHPPSAALGLALTQAADAAARSGAPPATALAMEVATAVMFLEAAFEELDPADTELTQKTNRLAQRLERVQSGGNPEPLETWIEDLYRAVSDRQTMGSVVGELRTALGDLERLLDQYFRNPADTSLLSAVPGQLAQMRGVLSVLGLDQAVKAVVRMRDISEQLMDTAVNADQARATGTFDKLGNNLGALGLLFDMLNYQPVLAKKLFIFDEEDGELKPLMGRVAAVSAEQLFDAEVSEPEEQADLHALQQFLPTNFGIPEIGMLDAPSEFPATTLRSQDFAQSRSGVGSELGGGIPIESLLPEFDLQDRRDALSPAMPEAFATQEPSEPAMDLEEDDLQGIFLEEASEVVLSGKTALTELLDSPSDLDQQTVLRRAFHTLKGSSRMVGLVDFGEAAWSMEQVLNTWLADRRPASHELRELSLEALNCFDEWAHDIAAGDTSRWNARMFQLAADALRVDGRLVAIRPVTTALVDQHAVDKPAPTLEPAQLPRAPETPLVNQGQQDGELSVADIQVQFPEQFSEIPLESLPEIASIDLDGLALASQTAAAVPSPDNGLSASMADLGADHDESDIPDQATPATELVAVDAGDDIFAAFETVEAEQPVTVETKAGPDELDVVFNEEVSSLPDIDTSFGLDEPEEQIKQIGPLKIGIPLYNVYLNEADEWSRRLLTELTEWTLELHERTISESTVSLAHSLAGSSATVGFESLSRLSRELEHALRWTQLQSVGTEDEGRVYTAVAEDIRRLLHQFAAGFLKEPDDHAQAALSQLHADKGPLPVNLHDDLSAAPFEVEELTSGLPEAAPTDVGLDDVLTAGAIPEPMVSIQMHDVPAMSVPVWSAQVPAKRSESLTGAAEDDDIESVDALDPDLFQVFEEEANDLMPKLSAVLRQWVATPGDRQARAEVLRLLHTLKGSARLAGAMRLGERAHRLETVIESLGSAEVLSDAEMLEPLLARFDEMQNSFDGLRAPADDGTEALVDHPSSDDLSFIDVPAGAVIALDGPNLTMVALGGMPPDKVALPKPVASGALALPRAAAGHAVRIRSQLLDSMVNQTGEVMMTRSRLEAGVGQLRSSMVDLTSNLERLRQQLRDVELQAELQMQSRLSQSKDVDRSFDPLEFDRFTRVQELTRMMAESVNDVATVQRNLERVLDGADADLVAQARQTRELQRDLLRTRMQEFDSVAERLYRVVRQASKEQAKHVKLDIIGGSIEMDRGVLERMTPAFEHMLRNAVAHGVETPEIREQMQKAAVGTIQIELRHEGNDVSITFSDDGAGLNEERILSKALSLGLVTPDQALSSAELQGLIFMPGFSTAEQVTELSGRGIGMDVVRSEVQALGGRIESSSELHVGTRFNLILPLTTAVTQVVMVRVGALSFGIPANLVEQVRRTSREDLGHAYATDSLGAGDDSMPFFWAGALLQSSARSDEQVLKTASVVVLRSAQQRVAVHVDEVLGNQEVVVKNLGPQLSRLPGLSGMTVLPSGAVILIYNPVALATVYGAQAKLLQQTTEASAPDVSSSVGVMNPVVNGVPQVPLVLVVDDSITVRRVTQRLLQREGYRVALAVDGVQALERLRTEVPAVMLSDIEMPRMDGFELVRSVRSTPGWEDLPVITISSRMAEKHRQVAREIGVNHYLGKPYGEEELLSLIRRYAKPLITAEA